jgi:topoisomerase IV subunit A
MLVLNLAFQQRGGTKQCLDGAQPLNCFFLTTDKTSQTAHESDSTGLVGAMYERWFLDYASYVILERAVPALDDGLKPVQRRILHSMDDMDDGRYNKVANIIGHTMQYHPHGDASIGDALVGLGQKDLLIDMQGNWGDVRTGDSAAAPRYIEARLSKLAKDIMFFPQLTKWQLSYDGRNKEPVVLPVKFPLLLAQGVEGIAVGLSTKILPHNFCELIEASIDVVNGKEPDLIPDFATGGLIDPSNYNGGKRGGKVRVRAKIEEIDKKTLAIREIPFGTTTESLIESIVKANDQGKIKIKKVVDNTAKDVEIQIQLQPGISPDITTDALFAFTDCELSISPNACVVEDQKPIFTTVNEILKLVTENTLVLFRKELELKRAELMERLLFSSLEKIFIENRIYRDIEECESFEAVIEVIHAGLKPLTTNFYRAITDEDVIRLTEIRIKRISKYDGFKADELMRNLQAELEEAENNLANLKPFAIRYFRELLKKYGKGRERKTVIRAFDTINASVVAVANEKLYMNAEEGFIGYSLKKDIFISDCSDLDDIIAFRRDGSYKIVRVGEKVFVGKDLLHVAVFRKNDERTTYNLLYVDGESGTTYAKRFQVTGITRDKEYNMTRAEKGTRVLYFSANPNGEAETVSIQLTPSSKAKIKVFDYNFATLDIKGRASIGNTVTKYGIRKTTLKAAGASTLSKLTVYYDDVIGKLNTDGRGKLLGNFAGEDRLLSIYTDGTYELNEFKLSHRFEPTELAAIGLLDPESAVTAIYIDGDSKLPFIKRFKIDTLTLDKRFLFLPSAKGTKLIAASLEQGLLATIVSKEGKADSERTYPVDDLVEIRGWKALGNRLNVPGFKHAILLVDSKRD